MNVTHKHTAVGAEVNTGVTQNTTQKAGGQQAARTERVLNPLASAA